MDRCASHKKKVKALHGKPNCGLCITVCPYGRKMHREDRKQSFVRTG
jgi:ferredoxin